MHDRHVACKITMISVLKLKQIKLLTEYYKQSQWIEIAWKMYILNVLFCSARYRLDMYFFFISQCIFIQLT